MSITSHTPVITEAMPVTFGGDIGHCDPEKFGSSYLLGYDFDGTCYDTSTPSDHGPAVLEAYRLAIDSVLGSTAVQNFDMSGGLNNQAPIDVVQRLIEANPAFVEHALGRTNQHDTGTFAPSDFGLELITRFNDRGEVSADELAVRAITEMLVARKKEVLLPQIDLCWPKPIPGFDKHWQRLSYLRDNYEEWRHVHTSIVSSGHTDFIKKALQVSGMQEPDVYVTDDEMRCQIRPRTKPDPFALYLARNAWFNAYQVDQRSRSAAPFARSTRSRQVYSGDDRQKDGEMARRDGIAFIHHDGSFERWGGRHNSNYGSRRSWRGL